ncbi:MAG TPA: OmpA family protein [Oligoflexus sp.]|uniref:OmpA family protein n=1 Tax=Oligoflexus sp. TaxID=1971216 RepID=UPI002D2EC1B7|nr:OmpA family protein [Oligoflexus sp.]HYX31652.1 OmpA family protein [Oligoflexus sp.]
MMTRMRQLGLCAALLLSVLPACTVTDAQNPEDILSEDDLDAPAAPAVADEPVVEDKAQPALAPEATNIITAVDDDVVDYAIADYKSFDPSGIIVHFEFDDARLSEVTIAALNKIVAGMKKDPLARVSVRGHADKQGTEGYNKTLSSRRAKVIEDYLIQHGIERDRLNPVSMGESDPIEDGNTVTVFKKNRRGDFTINYGPSAFGKAP